MDIDTSYVFFRKLKGEDGPIGAEGVPLTPRRSLAVDHKLVPYGAPVWLSAADPDDGQKNIERLMVAQDTGGAIVGPVRGDFFWGAGDEAAHKAGLMKSAGHAWLLLPKTAETVSATAAAEPVSAQSAAEPVVERAADDETAETETSDAGQPAPAAAVDSVPFETKMAQSVSRFRAWCKHVTDTLKPNNDE
jgi:3D (Asp-Asp-Asp) domain-containing protein